jgi:chromosome segregation ATPase
MIMHFCDALNRYSAHEQSLRVLLKRVRSNEEYLDRLKKDRRSVGSKADSAEKKLQKMTPESKNLHEQTDLLTRLREEMRSLDTRIMNEETQLGDFKRQASKQILLIKFGGLLECAEKAKVSLDMISMYHPWVADGT